MKGLKSENVDVSFILQKQLITPKKIENNNEKNGGNSWLGHKYFVS